MIASFIANYCYNQRADAADCSRSLQRGFADPAAFGANMQIKNDYLKYCVLGNRGDNVGPTTGPTSEPTA
jgi:hypothetical protein